MNEAKFHESEIKSLAGFWSREPAGKGGFRKIKVNWVARIALIFSQIQTSVYI